MKKLLIYSSVFILLFSCRKKELPKEEYTERVFYVNCNIDGQPTKLEAGNRDYYMKTSCGRDSNVYYFRGDLEQTDYSSGRDYAISFVISDYKVTAPTTMVNVDSVLLAGSHLYNTQIIPGKVQTVSFKPIKENDGVALYNWILSDGMSDTRSISAYSITEVLPVGKTYTVSLSYDNQQGSCQNMHRNVFRIGNRLQTNMTALRDSSNLSEQRYKLSYTIPPAQGPYSCRWNFSDGALTTPVVNRLFQPNSTQVIKLDLYNGMGDTCVSFYQLNAVNGEACHANYTAKFEPVKNGSILSTVKVLLTDKEGNVYSTGELVQPQSSYFNIEGNDPYKTNDKGQSTRSVKIKFSCVVRKGDKSIAIENGEGLIAVAHH